MLTDRLGATSLPGGESFSTFAGPQYGVRYGGVAFAAAVPEPSTWALMIVGVGIVGGLQRKRRYRAVAA